MGATNLAVPAGVGGPGGPVMDAFAPMRLAMAQGFNLSKKLNKVGGDGDRESEGNASNNAQGQGRRSEEAESQDSLSQRFTDLGEEVIPDMRESTARAPSFVGKSVFQRLQLHPQMVHSQ